MALVGFAGHGLEQKGKNYLLPVDAPGDMLEGEVETRCVSLDWIMNLLIEHLDGESLIIVLLDCCREETLSRGLRSVRKQAKRGLAVGQILSTGDSASVFVGYAAAPGMCAEEKSNRYPTRHVLVHGSDCHYTAACSRSWKCN